MGTATKLRDQAAVAELKVRVNEIEQCKKEYGKAEESLARLKTDPDDTAINLSVGRFYAFTKGDFERGLPFLAKGSDRASVDLAKKEVAGRPTPRRQAALADGWLELASGERELARGVPSVSRSRLVWASGQKTHRTRPDARRRSTRSTGAVSESTKLQQTQLRQVPHQWNLDG